MSSEAGEQKAKKTKGKGKQSLPYVKICACVSLLAAAILPFTGIGEKILRGIGRIVSPPKPKATQVTREDITRQVESRVRAEIEQEYEKQLAQLRKQLEESKPNRRAADEEANEGESPLSDFTATNGGDVRTLRSGIPFKSQVNITKGTLASKERITDDCYTATYSLDVRLPTPSKTLEELQTVNPDLSSMLPGLPEMMQKAEVSRFYYDIYDKKVAQIRKDSTRLNELISKHNLYDCETILNLKSKSGRKAFLLQADMDVVSDGSDGDRLPSMPDEVVNSTFYQPFTSYGWPKKTPTPNPIISGWEKRMAEANAEAANPKTAIARKNLLKDRVKFLQRGISDMKYRSFLIAEYDPFIVLPIQILSASDSNAPGVGDYCVIIHGKELYPAIVGDGGPSYKVGEASLRIAKQINPRATSYSRPESSLKVTYLVFPGSVDEPKGPPNYEKWKARCEQLLTDMGGIGSGYTLHSWENLLPDLTPPPAPKPPITVPETTPKSTAPTPQGATAAPVAPVTGNPAPATATPPQGAR